MNQIPLAILAIDDNPGDAKLLQCQLEQLPGYEVSFVHAINLKSAETELARPGTDVIFLDYLLGAETGLDALQAIRSTGDLRPVIVLTGQGDETIAVSLMQSGADDYLVKDDIDSCTLARAIDNARAQHVRRQMELRNRQLLEDLQLATTQLEAKNRHLTEMRDTAHQFVDHVSHEFRTPLTVIREFASIMCDGLAGEINAEQREYLEIIVHRVDDLAVLVDDMLDTSKLESGMLGISRTDCRVEEIVEHIRTTLERRARASNADLLIDIPEDLPAVYCDAEKIGRVITNLVINAVKFCGDPGVVALQAWANPDKHEVTISIIDNGPGISPENLEALFQRFQQIEGQSRKGLKGFGLGLSIAKELVNLSFGDITVESEQGCGSTFSFTVPFAERRQLLQRYLRKIEHLRLGSTCVSLIQLTCKPGARLERFDEIQRLVQHHIRRGDLLFRTAADRCLLVAAANQNDVQPMMDRIEKMRDQEDRSRPDGPLPSLTWECIGSWSIHTESDAFIEQFVAAMSPPELIYA